MGPGWTRCRDPGRISGTRAGVTRATGPAIAYGTGLAHVRDTGNEYSAIGNQWAMYTYVSK